MSTGIEKEAIFGVIPTLKKEKSYGFWSVFLISSGYMIATWCYTQGAYMAQELSFRQLATSVFGPNLFIITLVALSAIFAARYGVDIWIWLRSIFGNIFCRIVCVVVLIMVLPWFAVCADTFAGSMINLFTLFGIYLPSIMRPILSLGCVLSGMALALGGPGVIKWSSIIMVSALLIVGIIAVVIPFLSIPIMDILNYIPVNSSKDSYALAVEACAAFAISPCLAIAVIPRLCKNERKGYWATVASYGLVAPFFIFAGGVMTITMFLKTGTFSDDPTLILATLSGPKAALLSLLLVAFANIGTAGSGTYIHSLLLKAAFPKVKFKWIALALTIYMSILALWGGITEYFGAFISYSAFLQAPIASMAIVDFFLIRKQKVSLRSLYAAHGKKIINPVGIICLILGFFAGALIYNPYNGTILSPIFYLTTASGLSFFVGGLSYLAASRIPKVNRYLMKDSTSDINSAKTEPMAPCL